MKMAVLGTGVVGSTIASGLVRVGYQVRMGARARGNARAVAWAERAGAGASQGSFADAAAFAEEIVFNCTAGDASLEALGLAGGDNLLGKILVDIANPLDFSRGMPPMLTIANDDSLGERIQRLFPGVRVVKTLNTVSSVLMVSPDALPEDHDLFVSGDDPTAKAAVVDGLVEWFGWKRERIHDLGDITTARGTEMLLALWVRLYGALGDPWFNFRIVRGSAPS